MEKIVFDLPDYLPRLNWVPAPEEFIPTPHWTVYPPIQRMEDGRAIIDFYHDKGSYYVKIFDNKDHPNIEKLPTNCPRVIKALYRKEWQLKCLRTTCCSDVLRDMNLAFSAVEKMNECLK